MLNALGRRRELLIVGCLFLIAVARVALLWPLFCQTFDEPAHIAAAMEYVQTSTYRLTVQNPPLGRMMLAVPLTLTGHRFPDTPLQLDGMAPLVIGNQILYGDGHYLRNLTLARSGSLFWFALATFLVWRVARRRVGPVAALLAVAIFTALPTTLAFASLATNDMAVMAMVLLAVETFVRWLEDTSIRNALLFGTSAALALLAKLTAALFLPAVLLPLLIVRLWPRDGRNRLLRSLPIGAGAAIVAAALVTWTVYEFDSMPSSQIATLRSGSGSPVEHALQFWERTGLPLPAQSLFAGVEASWQLNQTPQYESYFLGQRSRTGWALFYPTVFALKTPLTVLLLLIGAFGMALHTRNRTLLVPLLAVAAMLASTTFIHTDAGIRYLLPIFTFVAIAAATALHALWSHHRGLTIAIVALMALESLLPHPDYLAYFNPLAGSDPAAVVIDSDLDWGQDLLRLASFAREQNVRSLSLAYFGTADPNRHFPGVRLSTLQPGRPAVGWIAISEMVRRGTWAPPGAYDWLRRYEPVATIGRSISVYYIEP